MRAKTEGQKRAVLDIIYAAWLQYPEQRLGQLIFNSVLRNADGDRDLFYVEDFELAKALK